MCCILTLFSYSHQVTVTCLKIKNSQFHQLIQGCQSFRSKVLQLSLRWLFSIELDHADKLNTWKIKVCILRYYDSFSMFSFLKFWQDNLFKLMHQLENTIPHVICCIKPNNKQLPGMSDKDLVIEQLRCCGVLEVVRISRSGYPTRLTHQEFTSRWHTRSLVGCWFVLLVVCQLIWFRYFRYGFLLPKDNACQDPLSMSVAIIHQFGILPELYQVGYTKIYFRSGQVSSLFLVLLCGYVFFSKNQII